MFRNPAITKVNSFWDKQIERADRLAAETSGSKDLLTFYAQLLRAQRQIYESLCSRKDGLTSGDLIKDLPIIRGALPDLLETVALHGPETLAAEAHVLLNAEKEVFAKLSSTIGATHRIFSSLPRR